MRDDVRRLSLSLMFAITLGLAGAVSASEPVNNALRFDATKKSVVDIGAHEGLGLDTWTIEAWFNVQGRYEHGTTGWWGTRVAPIVAKGIDAPGEGTTADINYSVGLGLAERLTADLEGMNVPAMMNAGAGANHPVRTPTAVARNTWHHVAYTYDGTTWRVYLDGRLDAWTVTELIPRSDSEHPVAIGAGRGASGALDGFFGGILDEVRIWDHARTVEEIHAGIRIEIESAPGLVARWGMNEKDGATVFDSSGNGYHGEATGTVRVPGTPFTVNLPPTVPALVAPPDGEPLPTSAATLEVTASDPELSFLKVEFFGRPLAPPRDDAFTVVVLPDTQFYTHFFGLDLIFDTMTRYAVDEVITQNVKLVVHVGDLVHVGKGLQWREANDAMSILDEDPLLPYIIGVGNHDATPNGDPCGTHFFNLHFGVRRFEDKPWYGGHHGDDNDNNYVLFSAGDVDYIAVSLEYNALPESIEWADGVLKAHADRRAILITHAIVAPFSGDLLEVARPIWDGVKHNPNVFLVLGGHVSGEGLRTEVVDGRTVHLIAANYQERLFGGNGYLRLLELSPTDDAIRVRTWSPTLHRFERDFDSEYWLNEDEPGGPWTWLGMQVVSNGGTAAFAWTGLTDGQTYEWRAEVSDSSGPVAGPAWSFEVRFEAGDADGDGVVDFADVLAVLGAWGTDDPNADVNDDGTVDFADLLLVLANWS